MLNPIEAQQICQSAEQALRHGSHQLQSFPGLLKRVITERLWEHRRVPGLGVVELSSFRDLITTKPLRGWGQDPAMIEAVIRNDAEVLTLWRKAMKAGQGKRTDLVDNINEVKPAKGTSRAYTLDRLQRDAPELYQQVLAKKLSANQAAIKAGFRKPPIPVQQLQRLWAKLSAAERQSFLEWVDALPGRSTSRAS
jgi:hypothetical protein